MNVSAHFSLAELTRTDMRHLDNTPDEPALKRLSVLCRDVLEPLRDEFGPLIVTSAYRSPAVNAVIGGSPTSAHPHGGAADLVPLRIRNSLPATIAEMVRWLHNSPLPVDQVIDERGKGPGWLHVGIALPWINKGHPRREFLTYRAGRHPAYQVIDFSKYPEFP